MKGLEYVAKAAIVLAILFAVFPSAAMAWKEFIPRPFENWAELEVKSSYETESHKSGANSLEMKDLYLKEQLSIYSNGYSYSPRFIQYSLKLSAALKQENSSISSDPYSASTSVNASAMEYDIQLLVLPEHPYKLRLFLSRLEPLFKEQFSVRANDVENKSGAVFSYRKKPYFLHLSYIKTLTEGQQSSSESSVLGASGTYFKDYGNGKLFVLTATYNRTDFSSAHSGLKGSDNIYALNNDLSLNWMALYSSISSQTSEQQNSSSGQMTNDNFSWNERLRVDLPLGFKSNLSYDYQKYTLTEGANGLIPERTTSNTGKQVELSISHRLYESLGSLYTLQYTSSESPSGASNSISYSIALNYSKRIPHGTLYSGISLGTSQSEVTGQTNVINESPPPITVPGYLPLSSEFVDRSTIRVDLKKPGGPELIRLEEDIHYTVVPDGNKVTLLVFDLPPEFSLSETYEFLVSYSLASGNFKIRQDTLSYNLSFDLFDQLLHPYFNYTSSKQELDEGTFQGPTEEQKSYAFGIFIDKRPFRAEAEYLLFDSNIDPYRQWKVTGRYTNTTPSTIVTVTAEYRNKTPSGNTSADAGASVAEQMAFISAFGQKRFPQKNLYVNFGATYSYMKAEVKSSGYSLNSALVWMVGKIHVNLGASLSIFESTGNNEKTSRIRQNYYFNLVRRFF